MGILFDVGGAPVRRRLAASIVFVLLSCALLPAQTRLRLSSVIPGTERVQLVQNGDFEFPGPEVSGKYPNPAGWNRLSEMFVGAGTNTVRLTGEWVAYAPVNATSSVAGLFTRALHLEPDTAYVLSAYLWNFGDATNHVATVVDLDDAYREPQLTLFYSDAQAERGYFVYQNFHTADTGTSVTLRVFYDGLRGMGAAATYAPLAAQWDNVAVTKAADFQPPRLAGTIANLRPLITITRPGDGEAFIVEDRPVGVPIAASAMDFDGSITKIEFFAGPQRLGEVTTPPYSFSWSGMSSGTYQLTAIARDDRGDTTRSAPVAITVTVLSPESTPLHVSRAGTNVQISWPASAISASLRTTPDLSPASVWTTMTNVPLIRDAQNVVTVVVGGDQQYFSVSGDVVEATTLDRKMLMGYQGWFGCPQDGSAANRWTHWFRSQIPVATNVTVDFWPDVSELEENELFSTGMTLPSGAPARVYSAYHPKTVARHFRWMREHGLDGVFLQRFLADPGSEMFAFNNQVALNVRAGAYTYGRVFAIMYDISGHPFATLVTALTNDWSFLAGVVHITNSPRYLHHKGKPVVALWGFGFTDRPGTPQEAQTVIAWFKAAGCTVMGGVPAYWRTLRNDSQRDPAWAGVYRSFDVLSPWAVGRFSTIAGADSFKQNLIVPDLTETRLRGMDYMPVVFPGFSWHNATGGKLNQIPRNGGTFYWRQVYNALSAGCTMVYGAMFDEVDEGTAMFKLAPTPAQLPAQGSFVPLNIDGHNLPSDWYLRLAGKATETLRGRLTLSAQMPIALP